MTPPLPTRTTLLQIRKDYRMPKSDEPHKLWQGWDEWAALLGDNPPEFSLTRANFSPQAREQTSKVLAAYLLQQYQWIKQKPQSPGKILFKRVMLSRWWRDLDLINDHTYWSVTGIPAGTRDLEI